MTQGIVEELGRIAMSQALAASLSRASGYAQAQLHREVGLEHLLLALTEDPDAASVLTASNVDIPRLNADVSAVIGRIEDRNPPERSDQIAVSPELRRILEAAGAAAAKGRRREINGAIVLAAIVGDGRTTAAHLLRAQGLTFEEAIRVLRTPPATAAAAAAAQVHGGAPQPHYDHAPAAMQQHAPRGGAGQRKTNTEDILASARERVQRARAEAASAAQRAAAQAEAAPAAPAIAYPAPAYPEAAPGEAHAVPGDDYGEAYPAPPPLPSEAEEAYAAYPDAEPAPWQPMPAEEHQSPAHWGGQPPALPGPYPEQPAAAPWPGSGAHEQPAAQPHYGQSLPGVARPAAAPAAEGYPAPPYGYERAEAYPPAPQQYPSWQPPPQPQGEPYAHYPEAARGYGEEGRTPAGTAPAAPAPSGRTRPATARGERRGGQGGQPRLEAGQLVENIPRLMRRLVPVVVEARIAKADANDIIGDMAAGGASVYRHDLNVTKAMSVRLRAPEGGFFIETASPETQWIENTLGLMSADFASWRWTVTPRSTGRRRLQLVVSARTAGADGLAAETALPERVIDVTVKTNYALAARTWSGWIAAAVLGGVLSKFGQSLMDASSKIASLLKAG